MSVFVISYDLKQPGRDYASLHEAIRAYGIWWHNLGSTWLIETTASAQQVANYLLPHIDRNDRLLVVKAGDDAAWTYSFPQDARDWMVERVWQRVV